MHYTACREFVERTIAEPEAFGLTPIVLSGFLRITTHRKIFKTPSPLSGAVEFVDAILHQPHAISVRPGPRHRNLFMRLSAEASATGNLIPVAYIAAIAIEAGCDLVTTDKISLASRASNVSTHWSIAGLVEVSYRLSETRENFCG